MYSRVSLLVCSLLMMVLASSAAHAACNFQPQFCNRNDETTKKVVVTCSPKKGFTNGGYVLIGSDRISLQEVGGTASATITVNCLSSGADQAVNVYKDDGTLISLGNFKSGKTKKSGEIDISSVVSAVGTSVLTRESLLLARESVAISGSGCSEVVTLTEKDVVDFNAQLTVTESGDPNLLFLSIDSLTEVFGPFELCGTYLDETIMTLDDNFVSSANVNLEEGTITGTMYTKVTIEGVGTFTSVEYLSGTFDEDAGTVHLSFDGDFENDRNQAPHEVPTRPDV